MKPRSTIERIPLFDVKAQGKTIRRDMLKAASRVLDSGHFILGPEVTAFEAEFAKSVGAKHCVGLSSGTQALEVALEAVGIGPGDEVIVPSFTFIATAFAVSYLGATPVFADVDAETLTLDPADVRAKLTSKTKAILPVHLFGWPADMAPLVELARAKGIKIIEDCAQAFGTLYRGRPIGAIGDLGCFSFYPTKNLGAAGDAGAVVTDDAALLEACHVLRNIGQRNDRKYVHVRLGYNYRLDEIQAAVLRVKLRKAAAWNRKRQRAAGVYRKAWAGLPLRLPPADQNGSRHSYHLFVIQTPQRGELAKHLAGLGVDTGVYYPIPLHLQPAYSALGGKPGDCPNSERAAAEVLALPLHPELSDPQLRRVADGVRRFFAGK